MVLGGAGLAGRDRADPAKVDVAGGAIAIGHPLGAAGAQRATTLLGVLERTGGRYGLQTTCAADATVIERPA
ncbi:hypothetical protein Aau02nite_56470 [Amorphoplanes auranticolor]|uniref:Thiolase C-terminal domain-containing protein n=1 Tax=Actinoplanes auranticolor TaxID=47988 RepID=A0A919VP77_9ACTN|nr:hypothetical protein Aau02nite_56470 [Actinoplanes auranticolor]